jgi:multidrug efflux system membrane fusion protein
MGQLETAELPPRSGRASERAPAPGDPRNRYWWIWVATAAVIVAGVWYVHGVRARAQAASAGAAGSSGRGGNYAVPVVVATARQGDLPVFFNGLGTVTPLNTVTLRSRVDGQIISVNFKEGQLVHQGELLVQIDPRPFQVQLEQAQGQLAKDQAQAHDAQVNYERYSLLYKEGVIPKQQLDSQQAQVGQFEGAMKADQAQIDNAKLQLTYSRVTAPITGRIGLRLVDPGNLVHATDANGLAVITQLQPIAVLFSLPQDQLPQVMKKINAGAQLAVEAYDRDNTTKIAAGKLLTIDNQIDTATGTYKLKAVFNNEDSSLFPNQFLNVHLLVDTLRGLTLVPAAAIQNGPQGTYVFVVGSDHVAKIRSVTPSESTGGMVGIGSGLAAGEVVVIDGQDKLQDGSKVVPNTSPTGNTVASVTAPDSSMPSAAQSGPRAQPASAKQAKGKAR